MPTVASLAAALARRTHPDKAAAWDRTGLQLGDPERSVSRVAVCHEASEAVVAAVAADPPDLVVTYHPLLFRPVTRLVAGRSPGGRAWRLAEAGVGLLVTHTDFDAAPAGAADSLAAALGLSAVVGFGPFDGPETAKLVTFAPAAYADALVAALGAAGAGRIGNYSSCAFRVAGEGIFEAGPGTAPMAGRAGAMNVEAEVRIEMVVPRSREAAVVAALLATHPYEEPAYDLYGVRANLGLAGRVGDWDGSLADLAAIVSERLGGPGVRVAGERSSRPGRVAVVPGSGGSFIPSAAATGAGAIVTGDVSHHQAVGALDSGVSVVDPSHAATEWPGMRRLVEWITALDVEVSDLTAVDRGPWG